MMETITIGGLELSNLSNLLKNVPGYYVIVPGHPHLTHRHEALWQAEKQKGVLERTGYQDVIIEIVGTIFEGFGEGHYVE